MEQEIKSLEFYQNQLEKTKVEFNEIDTNSYLMLFELNKKKFNYDVSYAGGTGLNKITVMFPSQIIVREFGDFSEKYMLKQLAYTKDIFIQLKDYFEKYPESFKFRFCNKIISEMSKLLNNNMDSKYYETYLNFTKEMEIFIENFNPANPYSILPKFIYPEIEIIDLIPFDNDFGNYGNGKFNSIFTVQDLGYLISHYLENYGNKNLRQSEIALLFQIYFRTLDFQDIKASSLETTISFQKSNIVPFKTKYNKEEAQNFINKFLTKAINTEFFKNIKK